MNKIDVLNDGFVRLVDSMGGDVAVVRSARVSYGDETKGEDADRKLIHYLLKHNHGTPFEHLIFTFHIRCPIFIARQWFRHRIGSFNEISLRYTEYGDSEFWIPDEWRTNNESNKQSSGEANFSDEINEEFFEAYAVVLEHAKECYRYLLDSGVAREQARAVLPLATYTEFYWTVNARSLFNFIRLRAAPDAQQEMQEYAKVISQIAEAEAPWTWEAFNRPSNKG